MLLTDEINSSPPLEVSVTMSESNTTFWQFWQDTAVVIASAFGRQRLVWRDGRDNFGGGALYEFETFQQHSGVAIPQRDVIRARRDFKAEVLSLCELRRDRLCRS